jgi:hypothetical protein
MNIDELISKLEDIKGIYGDEVEVIISIDAEGNDYKTIDELEFYNSENFDRDIDYGRTEIDGDITVIYPN